MMQPMYLYGSAYRLPWKGGIKLYIPSLNNCCDIFRRSEEDARAQATEAGVSQDVALTRDPDVLDTWFR